MDAASLSQVKSTVKAWERAFKVKHNRNPTKEDIKDDSSDIAQQYALYRRLSKTQHVQQQPRATPRIVPTHNYPITPTPPSRKNLGSSRSNQDPQSSKSVEGSEIRKRKASPPPSRPAESTARALFTTPKKNAYAGPIIDPNPINPFNIFSPNKFGKGKSKDPQEASPFIVPSGTGPARDVKRSEDQTSPFIHANSPRKLKEVLAANSYHRNLAGYSPQSEGKSVQDTDSGKMESTTGRIGNGITPRTRARKRLRGEPVEDTPVKERPARRRREQGPVRTINLSQPESGEKVLLSEEATLLNDENRSGGLQHQGLDGQLENDDANDGRHDVENEDDGLGPSPWKPHQGGFTPLFNDLSRPSFLGNLPSSQNSIQSNPNQVHDAIKQVEIDETKSQKRNRQNSITNQPAIMGFFEKLNKAKEKERKKEEEIAQSQMQSQQEREQILQEKGKGEVGNDSSIPILTASTTSRDKPLVPSPLFSLGAGMIAEKDEQMDVEGRTKRSRNKQKDKILFLGDGASDDNETVIVVPTRRVLRAGTGTNGQREDSEEPDETGLERWNDIACEAQSQYSHCLEGEEEDDQIIVTTSNSSDHIPISFTVLSLTSPQHAHSKFSQQQLERLRYRAIFNPHDRKRLEALKRGQDTHVTGEGVIKTDGQQAAIDEVLEDAGEGMSLGLGRGDDDWESDDEGWKRTEEGLDDGW
ncbi:uncharacterized protein L203_100914 [Cryptococcus depauperatus CBS 7841]|uniref:DNA replication regulator SLD2 n=1 Tax=Cryptococcus depauperatus CBS 7841 TaxID=1295531 RepID=A0A1E3I956_9TREE|nr:hypothetical protein L203_05112 [Cryptococcus depauperatus CBS 7841]